MQVLLQRTGTKYDATKKKDSFGTTFFKNILPIIFFNLVPEESFATKDIFSIKLIGVQFRRIVQGYRPDEVVTQNWPGYC